MLDNRLSLISRFGGIGWLLTLTTLIGCEDVNNYNYYIVGSGGNASQSGGGAGAGGKLNAGTGGAAAGANAGTAGESAGTAGESAGASAVTGAGVGAGGASGSGADGAGAGGVAAGAGGTTPDSAGTGGTGIGGTDSGSAATGGTAVGGTSAGGTGSGGQATGEPSPYQGTPTPTLAAAEQVVDVFQAVGNRYWFAVSSKQLTLMNEGVTNGIINPGGGYGDIYFPRPIEATYADHLYVTTAGTPSTTADYGRVQVRLVGQSTARPWDERSIPNLKIDTNEFTDDLLVGGYEHLRFNNGQVGTIFREKLTLDLFRRLGYPAPQATFAWVTSNVWGADVSVPYTIVEVYKKKFCKDNADALGGGCKNMWEFAGDIAGGNYIGIPIDKPVAVPPVLGGNQPSIFDDPANCQFGKCDGTHAKAFEAAVLATPTGEGYKDALTDWVDWDSFHRFQCLSWILAVGDDALHNQNNVVLVERTDGRFQYLPYSVDISLGQSWYANVTLTGSNRLSSGCQTDPACWEDTLTTCKNLMDQFIALDPVARLEDVYSTLSAQGMLRDGDDTRHSQLRTWFENRIASLPEELEANRPLPSTCQYPYVDCGGYCDYAELCQQCIPPKGGNPLVAEPIRIDGVLPVCPDVQPYPVR